MKTETAIVFMDNLCNLVEALLDVVYKYEEFTDKMGVNDIPKIDRQSAVDAIAAVRSLIDGKYNEKEK